MRESARRAVFMTVVLPVLFAASAGCDLVTADLKHTETAEWRRSYELEPGGRVQISNVNGKVEAQPSTGNLVEIIANKSARGATPEAAREALERVEIREEASPSSVRVETKVQGMSGLMHRGSASVHYIVRVPAGSDASFTTVNGGVELRDLQGRLRATTTNGGINARNVSGSIHASTTNGGVEVDVATLNEDGARLECTNGGIRLRLPPDTRATISASVTNGGIDASGLQLDTTESTRRRLEAQLNGGGAPVHISGTNGGIRIGPR